MNRIMQLLTIVLGIGMLSFTANAQLTVTGGDLLVPNDSVGIGVDPPLAKLHVKENGNTGTNDAQIYVDGNDNRLINFVEGTTRRGGLGPRCGARQQRPRVRHQLAGAPREVENDREEEVREQ